MSLHDLQALFMASTIGLELILTVPMFHNRYFEDEKIFKRYITFWLVMAITVFLVTILYLRGDRLTYSISQDPSEILMLFTFQVFAQIIILSPAIYQFVRRPKQTMPRQTFKAWGVGILGVYLLAISATIAVMLFFHRNEAHWGGVLPIIFVGTFLVNYIIYPVMIFLHTLFTVMQKKKKAVNQSSAKTWIILYFLIFSIPFWLLKNWGIDGNQESAFLLYIFAFILTPLHIFSRVTIKDVH